MIEQVTRYFPVTPEHILRYAAASNSIYKVHIMQALLDLGYDTAIYGPLYQELFSDKAENAWLKPFTQSLMRFWKQFEVPMVSPFLHIQVFTVRWIW